MLSSVTRAKHLCLVAQCISKTEFLTSLSCVKLQKAFISVNSIRYRRFGREEINSLNQHELLVKSQKNENSSYGKIVTLDPEDCEEYTMEEVDMREKKKKKRKKEAKVESTPQIHECETECEEENFESSDLNEINKSDQKKILFLKEDKSLQLFRRLMNSMASRKSRQKEQKIILEGKRLIHEGISAGFKPKYIFFSRLSDIKNFKLPEEAKLCKISYKTLQLWTKMVTSQGVVGFFDQPNLQENPEDPNTIPLTVICDNVRDPGNMGSILRILAGVGCQKAILTKGCVDIWEPKVIRAAAGAHFHLPVYESMTWTDIDSLISEENQVFLADCNHAPQSDSKNECIEENVQSERGSLFKTTNFNDVDLPVTCYDSVDYCKGSVTIIIGGETHGLSEYSVQFGKNRKGVRVYIPTSKRIESLNNAIALGILSFEVRRQYSKVLNDPRKEFCENEPEVVSRNTA